MSPSLVRQLHSFLSRYCVKPIVLICFALFTHLPVALAASGITYQGRLLKPDGTPVTSSNVQFRMQIRTPGAEDCLMYEETQTHDLSSTSGMFAISLNDGSGVRQDTHHTWTLFDALSNRKDFTFIPGDCSAINSYSPGPSDNRKFRVSFKENPASAWEDLPVQTINYIPMSIESYAVGGFTAKSLLRVEDAGTLGDVDPITTTQYDEIIDLVNGNSSLYSKPGELGGSALPSLGAGQAIVSDGSGGWQAATPLTSESDPTVEAFAKASLPTCGVGEILTSDGTSLSCVTDSGGWSATDATDTVKGIVMVPTSGGLEVSGGAIGLPDQSLTPGSFTKVTVDQKGRVTSGTTLSESDIPNLTSAGNGVDGGAITSGTIGGTTSINSSGNIYLSGATSKVTSNYIDTRRLTLFDDQTPTPGEILLRAPATVSSNYTLTLPDSLGSANQILGMNSAGTALENKSITAGAGVTINHTAGGIEITASGSGGTVTSVFGTSPISVVNGTTTPTISLDDSGVTAATYGSATEVPVFTVDSKGRITGVTDTAITGVSPVGSALPNGQAWIGDGSNEAQAKFINIGDIRSSVGPGNAPFFPLTCTASQTLTWDSLADVFECEDIAIPSTQVSGLGSAASEDVGTGAGNVVQLDGSGKIPSSLLPNAAYDNIYFKQGGNSFGAPAILGTNDTQDLQFETDGTVRMAILSDGKVGIGTTTPYTSLEVISNTNSSAMAISRLDNSTQAAKMEFMPAGAHSSSNVVWAWGVPSGSNNMQLDHWDGISAANVMTVANTGNVGIGTTDPESLLDIQGPSSEINIRSTDTTGNSHPSVYFKSDWTNLSNGSDILGAVRAAGDSNTGGRLEFHTADPSGNLNRQLDLNANGLLVLGASHLSHAPVANFQMVTDDDTSIMLNNTTSGTTGSDGLEFLLASDNSQASILYKENAPLILGTNNLERVRIAADGNVGIGTNSPNASSLLDISSTSKGVLIPRMTAAQRDAIATPAIGLQVYNTDSNTINYYDGSSWVALGVAGSGIQSLNGLTENSQSFAIGTSGTEPQWSSVTGTHTLNIPMASAAGVNAGLISKTDYDEFNSKLSSSLASGSLLVGNGSGQATPRSPSGDLTMDNLGVFTLANTAVTAGTYGSATEVPVFTVDSKGRITGVTDTAINIPQGASDISNTPAGNISSTTVQDAINELDSEKVAKAGDTMTGVLAITANPDATESGGGAIVIGDISGENLAIDGNEIMARNNGSSSTLYLQESGGNVISRALTDVHLDRGVTSGSHTLFRAFRNGGSSFGIGLGYIADGSSETAAMIRPVGDSPDLVIANDTGIETMRFTSDGRIGIGTTSPHASSILDITSPYLGVLIPRMNAPMRDAITSPATGLQIYNTDSDTINYYNGSSWVEIGVAGSGVQSLNGLTETSQSFAIGTSGTEPGWSSLTGTHTLNIPMASSTGVTAGLISKTDYDNFNTKLDAVTGSSLSSGNIWIGNGSNEAQEAAISGDLSMTNTGTTTVTGIQGTGVSSTTPTQAGLVLKYNGTNYEPEFIGLSDLRSSIDNTRNLFPTNCGAGETLEYSVLEDVYECTPISVSIAAADVANTPSGSIASTDVQSAMNELDSEKVSKAGDTMTGQLVMGPKGTLAGDGGSVGFAELTANGTNQVILRAPDSLAVDYTLTLPADDGTSGQVLTTDGSGVLSWQNAGTGGYSAGDTILAADGTAAAPGFAFNSDNAMGMYRIATQQLGFAAGSGKALMITGDSDAYLSDGLARFETGLAAAPTYSFHGDTDTGMWHPITDTIAFATAGTERMRIDSSGNIGVGTTNPGHKLDISESDSYPSLRVVNTTSTAGRYPAMILENYRGAVNDGSGFLSIRNSRGSLNSPSSLTANQSTGVIGFEAHDGSSFREAARIESHTGANWTTGDFEGSLGFATSDGTSSPQTRMYIGSDGNVGIGTTNPQAKLDVNGIIRATEICDETGANCKDVSTGWSGSGTPGGSDTQIQFNDGGAFAGANGLIWDKTSSALGIGSIFPGTKLTVTSTYTDTGAAQVAQNISSMTLSPATNSSSLFQAGYYANVTNTDVDFNTVTGVAGEGYHLKVGTVSNLYGVSGISSNLSTGTVTQSVGGYFRSRNAASGTMTTGIGVDANVSAGSSGVVTTAKAGNFSVTGSATANGYGVYIDSIAGSSSKFSLYASDATAPSYFAGNVGIGTTTPPALLSVEGVTALRETTAPTATANYGKIYVKTDGKLYFMNSSGVETELSGGGGSSQWSTSGSDIYYASGRVGVGGAAAGKYDFSVRDADSDSDAYFGVGQSGTGTSWTGFDLLSRGADSGALGDAGTKGWSFEVPGDSHSTSGWRNDFWLSFWNGSGWIEVMTFDSVTGNVGIGTNAPSEKLYVDGNIKSTGRIVASVSTDSDALSNITVEFSSSNMVRADGASGACGTLNFANVEAGGSYTVTIPNATATCSTILMSGSAANVKLPSGYAGGESVSGVVYTAIHDGTTLWVSYVPF